MKYREQMIKDIFYMAGLLEGMTCMHGQPITEAMTDILADCVDRLDLIGAALQNEAVSNVTKTESPSPAIRKPVSRPINKRPGRCVCVCTAKGKIVYIEDQYSYNKNIRR